MTPYTVLGVSRSATAAEITRAYRNLLRAYHPDTRERAQPADGDPDAALREVLAAYDVLRDPHQRAAYDRLHPAPGSECLYGGRAAAELPIRAGPVYWWPS